MKTRLPLFLSILLLLFMVACSSQMTTLVRKTPTPASKGTATVVATVAPAPTKVPTLTLVPNATEEPTATKEPDPTVTVESTATLTATVVVEPTHIMTVTVVPTATEEVPTPTAGPTMTTGPPVPTGTPFASASLCPDVGPAHDHNKFHTVWDGARGCHYDHEHGVNPFTPEVAAAFPGFDLRALLGNVEIGHTNPSSSMENTHKHTGFKWEVKGEDLSEPPHLQPCVGFEGATHGADASVVQYHAFGTYGSHYVEDENGNQIPMGEMEGSIHSLASLIRQCNLSNPADYGYIYVVQHVNYGQRITPYQGTLLPYGNQPQPPYATGLGPYLSVDCIDLPGDPNELQCRDSLDFIRGRNLDANSNWTTKPQGQSGPPRAAGSPLSQILFRVRDTPQVVQWEEPWEYPLDFKWICSQDGGATFSHTYTTANGLQYCRYTNSTTQVHELAGIIPAAWDNLPGFDSNPASGRITAEGYVTAFGELHPECTAPGAGCHPIKMVDAFVGHWGSVLLNTPGKSPPNVGPYLPSRDVWFCGPVGQEVFCAYNTPGARPSGWLGPHN